MSNPMARFSPLPSLGVALRSFCCRQISTSSSIFLTSKTYCGQKHALNSLQWSPQALNASKTRTTFYKAHAHRHTDLWVLKKSGFMVNAASGTVAERVVSVDPGAPHHLLLPSLMNAQVGCVYQSTQDQVGEVVTEILKVHPGDAVYSQQGKWSLITGEFRCLSDAVVYNSPKPGILEIFFFKPDFKAKGQ